MLTITENKKQDKDKKSVKKRQVVGPGAIAEAVGMRDLGHTEDDTKELKK